MPLLTQNSDLRRHGIHNWTLPAWVATLPDGRHVNVCPQAGACVKVCYARNGTYNFRNVKAAHVRNLQATLDDLGGWMVDMLTELDKPRFRPTGRPHLPDLPRDHLSPTVAQLLDAGAPIVRVHDAGDFYSDEYLLAWLSIASQRPDVLFYAYTKAVSRVRRVMRDGPANFLVCYSMGGREDQLIDKDVDQHADVFPDDDAITAAGYYSQEPHDLLCVVAPTNRVGIPANNIPAHRKRQGPRTFSEMEQDLAARRHSTP